MASTMSLVLSTTSLCSFTAKCRLLASDLYRFVLLRPWLCGFPSVTCRLSPKSPSLIIGHHLSPFVTISRILEEPGSVPPTGSLPSETPMPLFWSLVLEACLSWKSNITAAVSFTSSEALIIPSLTLLLKYPLPISSSMEYLLPYYSSFMEYLLFKCRFTTLLWVSVCFFSSSLECLLLDCRLLSLIWMRISCFITLLGPTSTYLFSWLLHCGSCATWLALRREDCSTDTSLSVVFKGSAFRRLVASAFIADLRIVEPALAVVSITGISSLFVFFAVQGIIPLLRSNVAEIRRRLDNVYYLCMMYASIFCFCVFRLAFVATDLLAMMALLSSCVFNSSFHGE